MPQTTISSSDIKKIRAFLDFTKGEFADLIGTSRNTLRKWEEEGLYSSSTASERNMESLFRVYNADIIDKELLNLRYDTDTKRKIIFALMSLFGTSLLLDREQKEILFKKTMKGIVEVFGEKTFSEEITSGYSMGAYLPIVSAILGTTSSYFVNPFQQGAEKKSDDDSDKK